MTWRGQAYFFFGTLLDRDVLARVLGRSVGARELTPARLDGYARVYARDETFPVLVGEADSSVMGAVMRLSPAEIVRTDHYEDMDVYTALPLTVTLDDGTTVTALTYMATNPGMATNRPWCLDTWRHRHKAQFLARIGTWTVK